MKLSTMTGVAVALGTALAVAGCATLGIGPHSSDRPSDPDRDNEVEATQYLAERGVDAAHRIAQATATQQAARNQMNAEDSGGQLAEADQADSAPNQRTVARTQDDADPADTAAGTEPPTELGETDENEPSPSEDGAETAGVRRLERQPSGDDSTGSSGTDEQTESVDPRVESARLDLSTDAGRETLKNNYDVDAPARDKKAVALTGTFRQDDDLPDDQLAVVVPGRQITFYAEGQTIASLELGDSADLPDDMMTVDAVRSVRDGTLQVLCYWSDKKEGDDDGGPTTRYHVGVFKVIGEHVGRIFERTVAVRDNDDDSVRRRGFFEFLNGDDHRHIQWTPANDKGKPVTTDSVELHWNKWEGVYREPTPPPTAPDNRS